MYKTLEYFCEVSEIWITKFFFNEELIGYHRRNTRHSYKDLKELENVVFRNHLLQEAE